MSALQHAHASRFLKMMLSWDYALLWEAYRQGSGVVDDLPTLPTKFGDVQVRTAVGTQQPITYLVTASRRMRHGHCVLL